MIWRSEASLEDPLAASWRPHESSRTHCRATLIRDVDVVKFGAVRYQRSPKRSGDQRPLWKTPWRPLGGLLGAQEHRRATLIRDVDVAKSEAVRYQRSPKISGDQRALWKTPWSPFGSLLGAQDHRRETLICDVDVVKFARRCLRV